MNATSSEKKSLEISAPCKFKLIYIYRINRSAEHKNCLKIGEATLHEDRGNTSPEEFPPNCQQLREAARSRVKEQTHTAGLFNKTEILHAEIAVTKTGEAFRDVDVHRVLQSSNIARAKGELSGKEWFVCDLETAKSAIAAVKAGKKFLGERNISQNRSPIEFRPEQERAIKQTVARFQKGHKRFLWNAKMRFGKTLCALEVARRMKFKRTIIVTHRPDVKAGWLEDFGKIFFRKEDANCHFGVFPPKPNLPCADFKTLEESCSRDASHYVLFVSIQFLRNQENRAVKDEILGMPWDFVVIDECHEGTQTELGQDVLNNLIKAESCYLALSGTPFNVVEKYEPAETFTWDYIEEQRAKREWDENHPGEPNPYASLPCLRLYTYSLEKILGDPKKYIEVADKAFSFSEFFRVENFSHGNEKFVHERDVKKFLDLLAGKYAGTKTYPFANEEFRAYFRHSFWVVPGVKEARLLEKMLKAHDVFQYFEIVNVAGDGNADEGEEKNALTRVKKAIKEKENDCTITISCGRLTTGVTVPEWTAVFYLAGSYHISPAAYMQTIFRVQSPGSVDGRAKEECYVFDFAPDRTLSIIEQVAQISVGARKKDKNATREDEVKAFISNFTNFAPVIAFDGSATRQINTEGVLHSVKKMCIAQVMRSGFKSPKIFNSNLWDLSPDAMKLFADLEAKIGKSKDSDPTLREVVISNAGLDNPESKRLGEGIDSPSRPAKRQLSEEEKQRKSNREKAIAILTNATVRCPLLVFGAQGGVQKTFSPETFAYQFDDASWSEFMGELSKKDFTEKVAPFLETTVFTGACARVRERVEAADTLPPFERIKEIVGIHSEFKNPDKETVLTPWRVVNMQLGDTLAGYNFFDKNFEKELAGPPRFIDGGEVTSTTLGNANARILEINSKTGLYPLFVAYSLMRAKLSADPNSPRRGESESDAESRLWKSVVAENVFVVCRTEMAAAITRRTLLGFDEKTHANIIVEPNLTESVANEKELPALVEKLRVPATYKNNFLKIKMLKFNAIVGNPPYQKMGGSGGNNDAPVYQHFVRLAQAIEPDCISLIIKAAWFTAGRENLLGEFRREMLENKHIQKLVVFSNSKDVFPSAEIKGGICYFLENKNYKGKCDYTYVSSGKKCRETIDLNAVSGIFIRDLTLSKIVQKVEKKRAEENVSSIEEIISSDTPFGIPSNPESSAKNPIAVFKNETADHNTRLFYNAGNNERVVGFVRRKDIKKNKQDIDAFKVFIPCAGGTGVDNLVLGVPRLAPKNSVCSQTYLYAAFKTKKEAENFIMYYKTRFFRALVSALKITQSAPKRTYRFVPVQDFSKAWTDEELYEKYALTAAEIDFINKMIRPMQ